MKFGKRLKLQIEETLPEWRDKFLSYKGLKRLLRLAKATPTAGPAEVRFVPLLIAEVEKLNNFFVEQEEDFIIRQKELKERIQTAVESVGPEGDRPSDEEYKAEMWTIWRDIVNLHGEMVLLESYSNVNYTGLAKILKKYDKRTGRLLRLPFIEKVLKQPFFTTDLISKLVKELESTIDAVFPTPSTSKDAGDASAKISPAMRSEEGLAAAAEQGILRSTVAALVTMREIRQSSSTYSHFSLPPLTLPDADVLQSFQLPSPIPTQ